MNFSYPVSQAVVNQKFGENPEYYARFHDQFGKPEKGHMGVDFMAAHGTPLYAPCDGSAKYMVDDHGGDGIHLTFSENGQWYLVILWHMCSKDDKEFPFQIPTDGSSTDVKRGQFLGYTDNSGAPFESSGDHLHFGLIPLKSDGIRVLNPANGFNGAIDPLPNFDGTFAHTEELPPNTKVSFEAAITNLMNSLPMGSIRTMAINILKKVYKR